MGPIDCPETSVAKYQSFYFWRDIPHSQWARASFTRFLDHTQRRITVGRTPLDEWSASRTDLYLTTLNTHNTDIHALGGIRIHNPSQRTAADLCFRPRGHCDRQNYSSTLRKCPKESKSRLYGGVSLRPRAVISTVLQLASLTVWPCIWTFK